MTTPVKTLQPTAVSTSNIVDCQKVMGAGANTLAFTLKFGSTRLTVPPPNGQWFIVWNRATPNADFDRWYVAMRTDADGTQSFEYGKFGVSLPPIPPDDATVPNPNANTPVMIGALLQSSTGVITITLPRD